MAQRMWLQCNDDDSAGSSVSISLDKEKKRY